MQLDWKTTLCVLLYVGFGVAGQLVVSHAMRQMPPVQGFTLSEIGRFYRYVATTPAVLLGIFLLAINFSMLLGLLSRLPVSTVVPASASSYLVLAILDRFVLREQVTPQRWAGVLLVSVGVALVLTGKGTERPKGKPGTVGSAGESAHP